MQSSGETPKTCLSSHFPTPLSDLGSRLPRSPPSDLETAPRIMSVVFPSMITRLLCCDDILHVNIFILSQISFLKYLFVWSCQASVAAPRTFTRMWDLSRRHMDSLAVAHGFGSCSSQASLLRGTWDLRSPTRDQTHAPCVARQILNHWTTREIPQISF